MNGFKKLLAITFLSVAIVGCTVPITTYTQEVPVKTSADRVKNAILKAGANREWNMRVIKNGLIEGTLSVREHFVKVNITYTSTDFKIDYVSSQNMNEANGSIHRKYNGWVTTLGNDVRALLLK